MILELTGYNLRRAMFDSDLIPKAFCEDSCYNNIYAAQPVHQGGNQVVKVGDECFGEEPDESMWPQSLCNGQEITITTADVNSYVNSQDTMLKGQAAIVGCLDARLRAMGKTFGIAKDPSNPHKLLVIKRTDGGPIVTSLDKLDL